VLAEVYQTEKSWVADLDEFYPPEDLEREHVSWFLAEVDGRPVGVARVLYQLPVDLYRAYGFELVDKGLDVEAFLADHRIAEVGRFAVISRYRKRIMVAVILMRAAANETLERGFTHFITDVFETDPNSPMKFHQRILGFQTVATHSVGELNHMGRRITMLLDLKGAFQRLKLSNNWVFRYVTQGWSDRLVQQLSA
jgi:ribosomal protein S18 acetylase RimI-like enzyme